MTDRNAPTYTIADWLVESNSVLWFGGQSQCQKNAETKTIVAVGCDGEKQLFKDTVKVDCGSSVNSCIFPLSKDAFLLQHVYTEQDGATQLRLRIWDTKKKKKLKSIDWSHDGGEDTELLSVVDTDNDGVPEITYTVANQDKPFKVLRWNGKAFVEAKKK